MNTLKCVGARGSLTTSRPSTSVVTDAPYVSLFDELALADLFGRRDRIRAKLDEGFRYWFSARPDDAQLEFLAILGPGSVSVAIGLALRRGWHVCLDLGGLRLASSRRWPSGPASASRSKRRPPRLPRSRRRRVSAW